MPSPEDCATLKALFDGVDGTRQAAEREWGCDRLPLLVSDELRAKFNRQKVRWSKALQEAWAAPFLSRDQLEAATSSAGGMRRAYAALVAAAVEAGHRPLQPWVWETRLADGTVAAIVQTNDEAAKVLAEGRYVVVYTLDEVGNVIDALPQALQVAKIHFPGAKVQPKRDFDNSWVKHGDPIPF